MGMCMWSSRFSGIHGSFAKPLFLKPLAPKLFFCVCCVLQLLSLALEEWLIHLPLFLANIRQVAASSLVRSKIEASLYVSSGSHQTGQTKPLQFCSIFARTRNPHLQCRFQLQDCCQSRAVGTVPE